MQRSMDARASFRLPGEKLFGMGAATTGKPQQNMFKTLRRLHGQNLENQGLNDLTEAFQTFVTRARFFSVGKLRRTWSHSAVEFMKYRRLLPMLLADGQHFDGEETDDFDAVLSFHATSKDDRRVVVSNVSSRVTPPQLQAFFTQFGKVSHCSLPREDGKKTSIFATMQRNVKTCGVATITFKNAECAKKAKEATPEQLKFYNQVMVVTPFVSRRKGGKGLLLSDDRNSMCEDDRASMTSSTHSLASSSTETMSLDDLPSAALERVLAFLPIPDSIRLERTNKRWLESSYRSWQHIKTLNLFRDADCSNFSRSNPLRNSHLKAILSRAGAHLNCLDISGVVHLLDSKALEIIANCCPNLQELDLSGVRATAESLSELSENLSGLKKLRYRDMINANDKALWMLVRGCASSLRELDLRGCRRMHGRCLRLFGPNLEQLLLDGCCHVDERALEDLCTGSTGLLELRLNDCNLITDANLGMISRCLPDLSVLTLCGGRFSNLTESGLAHIPNLSSLTELALDYNPLVSDSLLTAIGDCLHNLTSLSIANAGTDQSVTAEGLRAICRLRQLEQLDVSSLAALRSPVLLLLCEGLSRLEMLQARNCVYLSDEGLVFIGKLSCLRHLDLSGSMLITNSAVQKIINAFPASEEDPSCVTTVVVGGTAADASSLRVRGSRVEVNFADFSSIAGIASSASGLRRSASIGHSDGEESDDEFESLAAHRSFYMDAVEGEDDSPETEKELLEWAEREAKQLGLLK